MPRIVPATSQSVAAAAEELRAGNLVSFPTETVYGLGAAARDEAAVARIFDLKGRPRTHPLIVHLSGPELIEAWAKEPPKEALDLARRFWPGPLTLVLRRSGSVPDAVTGGQETVALRAPDHPVALALLREFGDGVAAPSANRFGRISPTRAEHVAAEFGGAGEGPTGRLTILDGGPCEVGLESTILDLSALAEGGAPRLLRPGGLPVRELERFLGRPVTAGEAPADREGSAAHAPVPRAPGGLSSHYAAAAPTRLVPRERLPEVAGEVPGAAVLALTPRPAGFEGAWLTLEADPAAYGRALYAALRELDARAPAAILIEAVPEGDEWLAVRDRLTRAAAGG